MTNTTTNPKPANNQGFSLLELLIVVAIILIISAIAIPNILRARMAANEAAAASSIRTLTSAAVVYASTWGNGLPPSAAVLGGMGMAASCDLANLLDPTLTVAPFEKSGYKIEYTGIGTPVTTAPGCGAPGYNEYLATGVPIVPGISGTNSYCSDEPGVIHFDPTGAKPSTPAQCVALPTL